MLQLGASGCLWTPPKAEAPAPSADRPLSQSLPVPNKDEVALINGRALSLSAFIALRSQVRTRGSEAVLWVGLGAFALQDEAKSHDQELSIVAAVEIARYAMRELGADQADQSLRQYFTRVQTPPEPELVHKEIDRLLASATVRRNNMVLASLIQP